MKAISLWQPWASAIALGVKKIETRSWKTRELGEIAICSAQKRTPELAEIFKELLEAHAAARRAFEDLVGLDNLGAFGRVPFDSLPFGKVVAVADLNMVGDVEFFDLDKVSEQEKAFGDYSAARCLWFFKSVKRLATPVPVIGRQQMFNLPADVEVAVRAQL